MQKKKVITKREAKVYALVFLIFSIFCLVTCVYVYLHCWYLKPGAVLRPDVVEDMRQMIFIQAFIIIPAISVLLMVSSRIIWKLCRLTDEINDPKQL
jgi:hypothetical protein